MDADLSQATDYELYKLAVKQWGCEAQTVLCIEELAELQQALAKVLRHGPNDTLLDMVAEEIADVEITLAQMKCAYYLAEEVSYWREQKTERLRGLLSKESGLP